LDFDDDLQHQQDDNISDGGFSNHDNQLDDDHILGSIESNLDEGEEEDGDDDDTDHNDNNNDNYDNSHDNGSDSDYHGDNDWK